MAAQWPPRSPQDALLLTPGGRERLRRLADRKSPTPSPSKHRRAGSTSTLASVTNRRPNGLVGLAAAAAGGDDMDVDGQGVEDGDEEEDEEMLQLKLEAIQAQLKLKKLQAAKRAKTAAAAAAASRTLGGRPESAASSSVVSGHSMGGIPLQARLAAARDRLERAELQGSSSAIQVPVSPVRKAPAPAPQTSPQRVLLGIDKGRRAADMSLKRVSAGGQRKTASDNNQNSRSNNSNPAGGGYLRRSKTLSASTGRGGGSGAAEGGEEAAPRPLSFSERLAAAKAEASDRQEKRRRIESVRSSAFSVGKQEMDEYRSKAAEIPDQPQKPHEFSRDEIIGRKLAASSNGGGFLHRSNTVPSIRTTDPAAADPGARDDTTTLAPPPAVDSASADANAGGGFEPYSGLHLSKRILPHKILTRAITGMKSYLIKDLLRHVKAPEWSLPEVEADVVVFAIVASKSEPRSHQAAGINSQKQQQQQQQRGKYMVMSLVDLTYEVELFLFNSGFDRFWKLTPGTVVAILNPSIMPPPPGPRQAAGRFGLVINSDADTILEVGGARDLGHCKSVRKDGKLCSAWVNARRTEYCEFHTNEAVSLARGSRVELAASAGFGNRSDGGKGLNSTRHRHFRNPQAEEQREKDRARQKQIGSYDRSSGTRFFVSSGAADLMDKEAGGGGGEGQATRAERAEGVKRRLAAREREREIARRLGQAGGGAGKEYMSAAGVSSFGSSVASSTTSSRVAAATSTTSTSTTTGTTSSPSTVAGGSGDYMTTAQVQKKGLVDELLTSTTGRGDYSRTVDLGPVNKRKRAESSKAGAGFGWGSSLTGKLTRMRDGEKLDGSKSGALRPGEGPLPAMFKLASGAPGAMLPPAGPAEGAASEAAPPNRRGPEERSPVRKKTRFMTDRGIREAGRESLGDLLVSAPGADTGAAAGASRTGAAAAAAAVIAKIRGRGGRVVLDDGDGDDGKQGGRGDDDDDDLVIVR